MGYFLFFMISFGAASRVVNGNCCVNVAHTTRILIVTIFTIISFLAIAVACMHEESKTSFYFWVAVTASVFTGIAHSFGEAVFCGFLKGFPSDMIGDVSVGTGFSGIFATGTLLLAKWLKMSNQTLFFIETPSIIAFYFAFKWLDIKRRTYPYVIEHSNEKQLASVQELDDTLKSSDVSVDIDEETTNN